MLFQCQCKCGHTRFRVNAAPIMRAYCHCSICQTFNSADYADVLVFRKQEISDAELDRIDFQTYKKPPAVQRGKCKQCQQPALEFFSAPLFPRLAMVPRGMFAQEAEIPEASMHLFYEHCVSEHQDSLPKHRGFIRSQGAFIGSMFKRVFTQR